MVTVSGRNLDSQNLDSQNLDNNVIAGRSGLDNFAERLGLWLWLALGIGLEIMLG